jgi:hypothetical protein
MGVTRDDPIPGNHYNSYTDGEGTAKQQNITIAQQQINNHGTQKGNVETSSPFPPLLRAG